MDHRHGHRAETVIVYVVLAATLAVAGCSTEDAPSSDQRPVGGESNEAIADQHQTAQAESEAGVTTGAAIPTQPGAPTTPEVLPTLPPNLPTPGALADDGVETPRYSPLPTEACEEILTTVEQALGKSAVLSEQPFLDYVDPSMGTGCAVVANGSGVELGAIDGFPGLLGAADAVQSALGMKGWVADPNYGAGSPNAVGAGLRLDDGLCLLVVRWQPSDDADCPPGQPFDECELTPEQRRYHVEINCASSEGKGEVTP